MLDYNGEMDDWLELDLNPPLDRVSIRGDGGFVLWSSEDRSRRVVVPQTNRQAREGMLAIAALGVPGVDTHMEVSR